MSKSAGFQFQQFYVAHDRCAMKVGTDGVLLGAMAPITTPGPQRILDIGTGTGLVALMVAQRMATAIGDTQADSHCPTPSWTIDAIDIDPEAAQQAQENFSRSPWSEHLNAHHVTLQDWLSGDSDAAYDMIVSNPPYFQNSLKNPTKNRETARHTDSLSYDELLTHSLRLMRSNATLTLILPAESESQIVRLAAEKGLYLHAHTRIYSKEGKPQLRTLLTWGREAIAESITIRHFYIQSAYSPRSEEYAELCRDFYL